MIPCKMGYTHYLKVNKLHSKEYDNDKIVSSWEHLLSDIKCVNEYLRQEYGYVGQIRILDQNKTIVVDDEDENNYCEALYIEQELFTSESLKEFLFCKTQQMPYDTLVLAVLFLVKKHFPTITSLQTDAYFYGEVRYGVEFLTNVFGLEMYELFRKYANEMISK